MSTILQEISEVLRNEVLTFQEICYAYAKLHEGESVKKYSVTPRVRAALILLVKTGRVRKFRIWFGKKWATLYKSTGVK